MRRLAAVFVVLLIFLQPNALSSTSRGIVGLFGEVNDSGALLPADAASPPAPPLPSVSLQSIFQAPAPYLGDLPASGLTTLIAVGDVIPARSVNYEMTVRKDFTYPFLKTYGYTRNADITLFNLEAPLFTGCQITNDSLTFCGDPRVVKGFKLAGVDVVNLPNNHIGSYGVDALHETEQHLVQAGIQWDGFGHIVYMTVHGMRFAFLAFNAVGENVSLTVMRKEVQHARTKADIVVVSYYWGKDYTVTPSADPGVADQDPRMLAHATIDAGADLVIGNNPQWVQGVEIYKGKFIAYAQGNFVSDQTQSQQTSEGVVGSYTFYEKKLIAVHYRPVLINNYAQPHFLPASQEGPVLKQMYDSSLQIAQG